MAKENRPVLGYAGTHTIAFAGRWPATLFLLAVGVGLWVAPRLLIGSGRTLGLGRWSIVALAISISLLPPVRNGVFALLDKLRWPTPGGRAAMALLIGVLATLYFIITAFDQGRDMFPKTHDDQSYLLQMRMLAQGRLWMPQHPLADFFDTFYVLSRPKYASLYFPGAALLYVPTIWLSLPTWFMPVCVAGSIVGLLYRIIAELLDGAAGVMAAVVLTSLSWFRVYSILLTSHEPMLLFGLLLVWCWLRWRRRHSRGWLLLAGVFFGWGAITRPADVLCFAIPIALASIWRPFQTDPAPVKTARDPARAPLARDESFLRKLRRLAAAGLLVFVGASPFAGLQLVFDRGVTGHWLQTPYMLYLKQDQPNTGYGFHPYDPNARPQSILPQKQDYYRDFFVPYIKAHQPGTFLWAWARKYLPMIEDVTLPAHPLLILLPMGFLGLFLGGLPGPGDLRGRRALIGTVPVFVIVYMFNTFFLEHYALLIAPAAILLLLCAGRSIEWAWPRYRTGTASAFAIGLLVLCLTTLPEYNSLWASTPNSPYYVSDETYVSRVMRAVDRMTEIYDGDPAVILFTYASPTKDRAGDPIFEEPVYNTQTCWPDDARLILAHDLGPAQNRQIFDYYAGKFPARRFYRFDRAAAMSGSIDFMTEIDVQAERASAK